MLYVNVFRIVLQLSGISAGGQFYWASLLLNVMADQQDANPVSNTFTNPYQEVLHRLAPYSGYTAYRELATLLDSAMTRWAQQH